jgi:hypothetical protein
MESARHPDAEADDADDANASEFKIESSKAEKEVEVTNVDDRPNPADGLSRHWKFIIVMFVLFVIRSAGDHVHTGLYQRYY